MSTLLSADYHGNPLPCDTWQDDYCRELPYFTHALEWRFRALRSEKRAEWIQEALVQLCSTMESQYRLHGGRVTMSRRMVTMVVCHVCAGKSCTRPPRRKRDILDRAPKRTIRRESGSIARQAKARPEVSPGFRLDVETWIAQLPPRLRRLAALGYKGTSDAIIRRRLRINRQRLNRLRYSLRQEWWRGDLAASPWARIGNTVRSR